MIVKRPVLTLWERLYLPTIADGLMVTFRHLFKKNVTSKYPEERWTQPAQFRGAPILLTGLDGQEKCTSCKLCQFICPPQAIRIVSGETENHKEKYPQEFFIDMGLCIFCGYCQEVCPVEAIWLKQEYELADYDRTGLIFDKSRLLQMGKAEPYLRGKEKPLARNGE
jgi:NADH-quinone oxidoreductase subunit I